MLPSHVPMLQGWTIKNLRENAMYFLYLFNIYIRFMLTNLAKAITAPYQLCLIVNFSMLILENWTHFLGLALKN